MTEHEDRLSDVERRLAALEEAWAHANDAAQAVPRPGATGDTAALEDSGPSHSRTTRGSIGYTGRVDLVGPVRWDVHYDTESTLALATDELVEVFAALAHPARLRIVRLLLQGNRSVAELQTADDFGTSGQLYHHLKTLTNASLVTKIGRNEYGVAATHTVPLLVSMLAAADVGGIL